MKLLKLQLENFRSHKSFKTEFEDENIILILGENGKGKTNILEGIFMLVAGKAFRDADNDDLIYWGMDFFTIKGVTDKGISLEVSYANYPRKQKIFKKNEVKISHNEYIGNFVCVLFHPKDLNMLYLEPSLRRKYMNLTLSQTDKFYLEALGEYTKILKHRNALLDTISEGEKSQNELAVWDEKLASSGSVIITAFTVSLAIRDSFFNSSSALFFSVISKEDPITRIGLPLLSLIIYPLASTCAY
mgnify:CR=1 FL=1